MHSPQTVVCLSEVSGRLSVQPHTCLSGQSWVLPLSVGPYGCAAQRTAVSYGPSKGDGTKIWSTPLEGSEFPSASLSIRAAIKEKPLTVTSDSMLDWEFGLFTLGSPLGVNSASSYNGSPQNFTLLSNFQQKCLAGSKVAKLHDEAPQPALQFEICLTETAPPFYFTNRGTASQTALLASNAGRRLLPSPKSKIGIGAQNKAKPWAANTYGCYTSTLVGKKNRT